MCLTDLDPGVLTTQLGVPLHGALVQQPRDCLLTLLSVSIASLLSSFRYCETVPFVTTVRVLAVVQEQCVEIRNAGDFGPIAGK